MIITSNDIYIMQSRADQYLNIKEQHTQHLKQLHDNHQKEVCYYDVYVENYHVCGCVAATQSVSVSLLITRF